MNKTATVTIAANAASPRLAQKRLSLHNYLQQMCSRRSISILNERESGGKIAHLR